MKFLQGISVVLLMVMAACVMACGGSSRHAKAPLSAADTIYTHDYIYQIHIDSPYKALALVDTAEQRELLTAADAYYLRSLVYFNALQRYSIAAGYAKKSYQSVVASQDSTRMMNVLNVYCSACQAAGLYSDALFGARKGIEIAKRKGDKSMQGSFLQNVALIYQDMGMREECIDYMNQSIDLFAECMRREGANFSDAQEQLFCMLVKIDVMSEDSFKIKEAEALLPQAAAIIDSMQCSKDEIAGFTRQRTIEYYGLSARVHHASGLFDRAEECYRKAMAMLDTVGHSDIVQMAPYLLLAHRYGEALQCVQPEKAYIEQSSDTLGQYFVNGVLNYERKALYGLGRYKEAAEVAARQIALNDTLECRQKKEQMVEQAVIYQTSEKELKLKEQAAELGRQRAVLMGAAVALLMLVILATTVLLYSRKIRRRNKATVRTIEQMMEQQQELTHLRRISMMQTEGTEGDKTRGEQLEKLVNERKMQLAVTLLKSPESPSMDVVAAQAGFSNVRAFSRQFERRFGLTPAEYAKWSDRIQKKEGSMLSDARRMTEQAQEMKNSFIRNMSHEIRTPLNQISGFVQLLTDPSREITDDEKRQFRDVIMEQTRHLTTMLSTLIALSDYETGKELEAPMTVNALQMSAAFRADCMGFEGAERVTCRVEGNSNKPFHISMSPVSHIVRCLVDNALKFSAQGTVEVVTAIDAVPGTLTVSVTDHGKGIADEDAERIFERFCKLDDYVPGAGLGLTLARTIARRLGGTLVLDTAHYSEGARFVLEVPVQE